MRSVLALILAGFALATLPGKSASSTSQLGLALIRHFEGYSPTPYVDPAGHKTIGFGHLIREGESFDFVLPMQADSLLRVDVAETERHLLKAVHVELGQWRFDALVSWTYNLGLGNLRRSTMLKRINQERHDEVPREMRRWVYAGGKRLNGLVLRRKTEAALYSL